jgi:hypothetical protein
MTDDEALLTRCLQALEESFDTVRNEFENDWRQGVPTRKAQLELMREAVDFHEQTINDLKARFGS